MGKCFMQHIEHKEETKDWKNATRDQNERYMPCDAFAMKHGCYETWLLRNMIAKKQDTKVTIKYACVQERLWDDRRQDTNRFGQNMFQVAVEFNFHIICM